MSLVHEVPTGLRVRPTVTVRHIPGKAIRLPARAGTLLLVAALIWGGFASLTAIPWPLLAGVIFAPASLIAALVELKPRAHPTRLGLCPAPSAPAPCPARRHPHRRGQGPGIRGQDASFLVTTGRTSW